jgi:hypothetical protein
LTRATPRATFQRMPVNIRDLAILDRTLSALGELIEACQPRKGLHGHDIVLTNEVMRQAKGLQTSVTKLKAAAEDPDHKPGKRVVFTPRKEVSHAIYDGGCMTELVRFVSYGGRLPTQMRKKTAELTEKYGDKAVMDALVSLTTWSDDKRLTVLRPDVRPQCRGLLGPPPEDPNYASYYEINRRKPPPEHQPPVDAEESDKQPKKGRRR